jgi:hypothetical protein
MLETADFSVLERGENPFVWENAAIPTALSPVI